MWGTFSQKATLPGTHNTYIVQTTQTHTVNQFVMCSVGLFVVREVLPLKTSLPWPGHGLELETMDLELCASAPDHQHPPPPPPLFWRIDEIIAFGGIYFGGWTSLMP